VKDIILIGDSIRIGYQEIVRRELGSAAQVWAPEENGGTSRNVLAHLDQWVISRKPDLVHLNCGLHDVKKVVEAPQPAVPLDEYRANLTEIFGRIQEDTHAILIWAATTPSNEQQHREQKGFDRFGEDILTYNREAAALAGERGIRVNDLYQVVMRAGRDSLLSDDGVHFIEAGSEVLGKAVADAIRAALKEAG